MCVLCIHLDLCCINQKRKEKKKENTEELALENMALTDLKGDGYYLEKGGGGGLRNATVCHFGDNPDSTANTLQSSPVWLGSAIDHAVTTEKPARVCDVYQAAQRIRAYPTQHGKG